LETVREVCRLASRGISPHLTLLFDLPVETGLERAFRRINSRDEDHREDRFEQEHLDFHRRIREGYLAIAREEPGRVKVIDASGDVESTRREVRFILSSFLGG
jgi:dTMP kinase